MRRIFVVPLVLSALLPLVARADECPVDTLFLRNRTYWGPPTIVTRDSSMRVSVVSGHPDFAGVFGTELVEYDLAAGSVHVIADSRVTNSIYCYMPVEAYARVRDTFTLFGPTGGASCQLTIRLDLNVLTSVRRQYCCPIFGGPEWGPPGIARCRLTESGSNYDEATFTGLGPNQTGLLSIEVTRAPGETFDIEIWAYAYAKNNSFQWNDQCDPVTGEIMAAMSIVGLPEGYGVRSCQGFQSGTVVPARSRSWGSIKTLYR